MLVPRSKYQNNFNGQVLGNRVWAFQRHQNELPTSTLPLILGAAYVNKR